MIHYHEDNQYVDMKKAEGYAWPFLTQMNLRNLSNIFNKINNLSHRCYLPHQPESLKGKKALSLA
jgi:hypothetical protein